MGDPPLRSSVALVQRGEESRVPNWAQSFVWLGDVCRSVRTQDQRLIVFVVVPNRSMAAAFIALGALLAGARSFADSLSWPRFRAMSRDSIVHWKERDGEKMFSGRIIAFEELYGTEFIRLAVTKPVFLAKKGHITLIPRDQFEKFLFTEDQPPAAARTFAFARSEALLKNLIGGLHPKWLWADGAEALIVTKISDFETALAELAMSWDGAQPALLLDLLCLAPTDTGTLAKVRITHPRGSMNGNFPLAILDGPDAFRAHEHLGRCNILAIVDRSEYGHEIHDHVLSLNSVARKGQPNGFGSRPEFLPVGIEIAAYLVDAK
jgi:hypothetical protein